MSWRITGSSSLRWNRCSLACIQVACSARTSTSTAAITEWILRFEKTNCTLNFSSWEMRLRPFYLPSRNGKFSPSPPKMNEAILRARPFTPSLMTKSWSTAAQTTLDTLLAANCSMRVRCALKRWTSKVCRRAEKRKSSIERTRCRMTSQLALLATKRSELGKMRSWRLERSKRLQISFCAYTS